MNNMTQSFQDKARPVKLLVLDMDGVMTDGRIVLSDKGEVQRNFCVYDGQGIIWLQRMGVTVAVITTCASDVVPYRMKMLGIEYFYKAQRDKQEAYDDLLNKLSLTEAQTAYMGDDLPDLPLIIRAGLGITVPTAIAEIKAQADYCTQTRGGHGAIREVCELIMKAQGTFEKLLAEFQARPRNG